MIKINLLTRACSRMVSVAQVRATTGPAAALAATASAVCARVRGTRVTVITVGRATSSGGPAERLDPIRHALLGQRRPGLLAGSP